MDNRYLRFIVHLIFLSRAVGFDVDERIADRLTSAYVDLLIEADKRDLVTLYASALSRPLQVTKMAEMLQSLFDIGMHTHFDGLYC